MVNDEMRNKIEKVADSAEYAFWEVVAKNFPEAESGDMYFDADITFRMQCEKIIALWVALNTDLLPDHWASEDDEE